MGTFDAALVMEEAGRTLATGPIAEAILAGRLLGELACEACATELEALAAGSIVATLAFRDIAREPRQWLAGGAHADIVVARRGEEIVLLKLSGSDRTVEPTLADNGIGEVDLGAAQATVLASGTTALAFFAAVLEEWKLLAAAQLNGLAREAIRLAAAYATERKAFGVPIGTYQAMSHPLANLIVDVEGGRAFTWKVICQIAHDEADAGAMVSLALWWAAKTASARGHPVAAHLRRLRPHHRIRHPPLQLARQGLAR